MIHPLTSAQLLELLTSLASAGKAPVTSSLPAQIIEYDRMNSLQQDMVEEIWMQAEREGLEEDYPDGRSCMQKGLWPTRSVLVGCYEVHVFEQQIDKDRNLFGLDVCYCALELQPTGLAFYLLTLSLFSLFIEDFIAWISQRLRSDDMADEDKTTDDVMKAISTSSASR